MPEHDGDSNQTQVSEEALGQKVGEFLDLIRQHSHNGELAKISDLDFGEDFTDHEREEILSRLVAMEEIHRIESADGRVFFYSAALMVDRYAKVLLLREESDPKLLIAETVREESQLYPRPTAVGIFALLPFKIPAGVLETIVAELLADEGDYADIKGSLASTGVQYLYSERHLEKQYADYLVEWMEVGQYENQ